MRLASALGTLGISLLLAAPSPAGEIHHYASTGKTAQVEALLRGGVSPDKADDEGRTPLYFAAVNKHPDVVRVLLGKGADPNIPTPNARTPLLAAARNGSPEIVQMLIDEGADLEAVADLRFTALHCAAQEGHQAIALSPFRPLRSSRSGWRNRSRSRARRIRSGRIPVSLDTVSVTPGP